MKHIQLYEEFTNRIGGELNEAKGKIIKDPGPVDLSFIDELNAVAKSHMLKATEDPFSFSAVHLIEKIEIVDEKLNMIDIYVNSFNPLESWDRAKKLTTDRAKKMSKGRETLKELSNEVADWYLKSRGYYINYPGKLTDNPKSKHGLGYTITVQVLNLDDMTKI